jgi:exonuclease III
MERNKGENEQIRIVFWNVAGIKTKEDEFWKYLGEFDVVGLVETWVEEKGWERLERRMPREFEWKCQYADRESKKGRAKGGIIMGVKKGLEEENGSDAKEERGFMERTVNRKQRKWRIVTIYSRSMKETKRIIEERVKEQEEGTLVIGGDFNTRIGGKGRRMEEEQATIERRPTKDGIENAEERELVSLVEERGWDVLNGNCIGDEKGEYTYIGSRRETVIGYVMVNEEAWDEIEEFKVGERVESDHMPLDVRTKGREQERGSMKERRTRIRKSRYNGKYEKIITEELPKYLGRESRKERVIIARFRCGNEERENKYWNEDRIRMCRMCGEKKETIEHLLNECVELRERDESREEMLNEDGRGIEWIKNIEWRRRTICGEG